MTPENENRNVDSPNKADVAATGSEESVTDQMLDEASEGSFPASDPPAWISRRPEDMPGASVRKR